MKQKYKSLLSILVASNILFCQEIILQFKSGQTKRGGFIGTYMNQIHLLVGENLHCFSCEDINKIFKVKPSFKLESFNYNGIRNT